VKPARVSEGSRSLPVVRIALASLGVALVALAVWLWLDRARDVAPPLVLSGGTREDPAPVPRDAGSTPVRSARVSQAAEASPPVADVPQTAESPETVRQFLSRYHGARWPELEAKLDAAGLELDQPYRFTPWEDVRDEFEGRIGMSPEDRRTLVRDQLRWSDELTAESLNSLFPLPAPNAIEDADVPVIEAIVAEKNTEITELAEYYGGLIDHFVHETWSQGDYVAAPFTTSGLEERRGFHTQCHGGRGWAVSITLTHEDHPEMADLEQRLAALCMERNQLVVEYLRERFGR
jgi:hypothetical protein